MSTDGGSSWSPVRLPHATTAGEIRYRRSLFMDTAALRQQWQLVTHGAGDILEVFLNGRYAGQIVSYGLPNALVLPPSLWQKGANTLELRVLPGAFFSASFLGPLHPRGCFRQLFLVGTPSVWIRSIEAYTLTAPDGRSAQVRASIAIGGEAAEGFALRLRLLRLRDSSVVAERMLSLEQLPQRLQTELEVLAPELWSPTHPRLYELRAELLRGTIPLDGAVLWVGFRSVGLRSTERGVAVTLNGQPLPLNGVEYYASAVPRSESAEIQRLKAAGVTVVRLRGVVPSPEWFSACAQEGLPLIVDIPATEIPPPLLYHPSVRFALQHYTRLLLPLLSNPAIVGITAWQGLPEHPNVAAYERELRQWLSPRNVLLAAEIYGNTRTQHPPSPPLLFVRLHPPFVSSALEEHLRFWRQQAAEKALLPVGGIPIVPGQERGYLVPHSEEAQARWIWNFLSLCQTVGTAGALLWSWQDYTTAHPLISFSFPATERCFTGIVDTAGTARQAYGAFQSFLHGDLEPLLSPGRTPWGALPRYVLLGSLLLLAAGWLLNRSGRLRHHLWRALRHSSFFFADIRDGRFSDYGLTLVVSSFLGLVVAAMGSLLQEWLRMQPAWVILLWKLLPAESLQAFVGWVLTRFWAQLVGNFLLWFLLLGSAAALIHVLVRLLRHHRLPWLSSFALLTWAALPLALPVPLFLVGDRFLEVGAVRLLLLAAFAGAAGWSLWRLISALHVLFRSRHWVILLALLWGGVLLGGIGFGIYESAVSLSAYLGYVLQLWGLP